MRCTSHMTQFENIVGTPKHQNNYIDYTDLKLLLFVVAITGCSPTSYYSVNKNSVISVIIFS